jgi:hypothetical protein
VKASLLRKNLVIVCSGHKPTTRRGRGQQIIGTQ